MRGMPLKPMPARIHHDQLAAAFGELFEISGSHRMVFGGISPNDNRRIGIFNFIEGRCHCP